MPVLIEGGSSDGGQFYDPNRPKNPKIDELSIYNRSLTIDEINNHNFFCILPPRKLGWDMKTSTNAYISKSNYVYSNDTVDDVDGTLKGYNPTASGKKVFEINVLNNETYTPYNFMFGVGIADNDANEYGLLYNVEGNELPCLENHIMFWVVRDSGTFKTEISYALDGNYGNVPVLLENQFSDVSYNTFTIVSDLDSKNITIYRNGDLMTAFDFSMLANPVAFKPAYSCSGDGNFKAILNADGDFEYEVDDEDYMPWGEGVVVDDGESTIEYESHTNIILNDNPTVFFPFNERATSTSHDVINGLEMVHGNKNITTSYGITEGYCLNYITDYTIDNLISSSVIPYTNLNNTEGAFELNIKMDVLSTNNRYVKIFSIKNESYTDVSRWNTVPLDTWAFTMTSRIIDGDTVMFRIYYANNTTNENIIIGFEGTSYKDFSVPYDPDGIYNIVLSFDENKRLWVYINGEVVYRLCGINWINVNDNYDLKVYDNFDFTSASDDVDVSIDNLVIYDKHLLLNDVEKRYKSIITSFQNRIDNSLWFLENNKKYTTTEDTMVFTPYSDTRKVIEYDDTSESWNINYYENELPIEKVTSSYDHTVYLHTDGTVSGEGDNSNNQINLSTFTNIIDIAAGEGFTVFLNGTGSVEVTDSIVDSWGIKNIPPELKNVVDIKSGLHHVVALTNIGEVICWGRNDDGQCTIPNSLPYIVQIAAGDSFTYALDNDGYLWTWGSNNFGETSIPTEQTTRHILIEADGYDFVGLTTDNKITHYGALTLNNIPTNPRDVVTDLAVGKNSILLGTRFLNYVADGTIQQSFENTLEINSLIDHKFGYSLSASYGEYVDSITVGNGFAIAIRSDNRMFGWGRDYWYYNYPLNFPSDIVSPKKVSATQHVLLLESDGTVKAWGQYRSQQTQVPDGLTDVIDVYAESSGSIAIKSDGTLVTWGDTSPWLPAQINPDYRKFYINTVDEVLMVLTNSGTIIEYRNNSNFSEVHNLSGVSDFIVNSNINTFDNFVITLMEDGSIQYHNTYDPNTQTYDNYPMFPKMMRNQVLFSGGETMGLIDRKGRFYEWKNNGSTTMNISPDTNYVKLSDSPIESGYIFGLHASGLMATHKSYTPYGIGTPPDITFVPDLSFTPDLISWDFLIDTENGTGNGNSYVSLGINGTNLSIDWGDGSAPTSSSYHNYEIAGIYPIKITGDITSIGYSAYITDIRQWGTDVTFSNLTFRLGRCMVEGGSITATDKPTFIGDISFNTLFTYKDFGTLNVAHWDTSNVTSFNSAFRSSNFNEPIGQWDTSNVTDFFQAFRDNDVFNQDIGNWDTGSALSMRSTFLGASAFNQDISLWDVSKVTEMDGMFQQANSFNQSLAGWNTLNVVDMYAMFYMNTAFNGSVSGWNTSKVEDMSEMFYGATSFNQPVDHFDTSLVYYIYGMFQNASSFNRSVNSWNVFNIRQFQSMFENATAYNQPMNNWDTQLAERMQRMFFDASSFLQDISMWDVDQVFQSFDFADNSPLYDNPSFIPAFPNGWQ